MLPPASRSLDPAAADYRGHPASIAANLSRRYLDEAHAIPVVFVVDDDVSVRESLELLICTAGWQPEMFESAHDFLCRPRSPVPSCLILDIALPGLNGLELQKRIAVDRTEMPIIFITGAGDVATTVQAMKAGAVEFLTKPFSDTVLLSAIQQAIARSEARLRVEAEIGSLQARYSTLSRREREVMGLVVRGLLNKQVGFELGISEITVKAHRGQVMRKMDARSLADLVNIAAKLLGMASSGEAHGR
jgi:FixJ family two-component response regulator